MPTFSTKTKTDIFVNLGIIAASTFALFFAFFFLFLPWVTRQGNAVSVPDLKGMSIAEMEQALDAKDLNFQITDSTFVSNMEPLSVFSQFPKAQATVKTGRTIYLTIITDKPPKAGVPDVIGRSLNSAKNLLVSVGFDEPNIEYIPAIEENTVLKIKLDEQEILVGTKIPKGTKLTMVVGDGIGKATVEVPDVTGMPLDEADVLINGMGLNVGSVINDGGGNIVTQQRPAAGNSVRTGTSVNLWVQ